VKRRTSSFSDERASERQNALASRVAGGALATGGRKPVDLTYQNAGSSMPGRAANVTVKAHFGAHGGTPQVSPSFAWVVDPLTIQS